MRRINTSKIIGEHSETISKCKIKTTIKTLITRHFSDFFTTKTIWTTPAQKKDYYSQKQCGQMYSMNTLPYDTRPDTINKKIPSFDGKNKY